MLSQQSKYALRAMIYLSEQPAETYVKVDDIASKTDLPSPYLSKIIKQLALKQIIVSRRGKNGGVQLNRLNPELTFFDICRAVADPIVQSECVLFKRPCDKKAPCPFHNKWSKTKSRLIEFLHATSLV